MLLSEALELFHNARIGIVSDATQKWYKARLTPLLDHLGDVEIDTITVTDLRRWRASLIEKMTKWENHPHKAVQAGKLSPHTLHGHVRACRTFFRWLEGEGFLDKSPACRLELPPLPKGQPAKEISPEDALRIIKSARDHVRDYAILCFLADTGSRVGGVATLTLDRLNLEPDKHGRHRAIVKEKGRGGECKFRTVYFNGETARALSAYLRERPNVDTDRVFLTQQIGREPRALKREGIYRMIERYAKCLGITGRWNPHAWRHRYAQGLIDHGVDISEVSQLMGHSSIAVTADIYGPRADQKLAAAHARGSWLNHTHDDE